MTRKTHIVIDQADEEEDYDTDEVMGDKCFVVVVRGGGASAASCGGWER